MQYLHGKNRAFTKDTEFPVFVSGDAPLALSRFKSPIDAQADARQALTRLELSSFPNNAEVDVDGKFISVTPATIGLAPGAHMIAVRSAGFQTWRQSLDASGGTVTKQVRLQQGGSQREALLSNCWGGTRLFRFRWRCGRCRETGREPMKLVRPTNGCGVRPRLLLIVIRNDLRNLRVLIAHPQLRITR